MSKPLFLFDQELKTEKQVSLPFYRIRDKYGKYYFFSMVNEADFRLEPNDRRWIFVDPETKQFILSPDKKSPFVLSNEVPNSPLKWKDELYSPLPDVKRDYRSYFFLFFVFLILVFFLLLIFTLGSYSYSRLNTNTNKNPFP